MKRRMFQNKINYNDMKQKILVVDDRVENLDALESILEDLDVEIIKALSGNEAAGLALKHDFALMLLDVHMPDIDGYETAEYIRKKEKNRDVPIIFISAAYKDDSYKIKGVRSGAVDFITKPVVEDILVGKVRLFLELHQRRYDALRRSEQHFQLLCETINEGFAILDKKDIIKSINNKFCELTGCTHEEITDRRITDFLDAQSQSAFHEQTEGNCDNSTRCEIVNKYAQKIPVLVSAKRLVENNNELSGTFVIFTEITEMERLQKEIVHISEKERQQFGHDLHDGLGQQLTGLAYLIEALKLNMDEKSYPEVKDLEKIAGQIDIAIDRTKDLAKGLCPVSVDRDDLLTALQVMAENVEKIFHLPCVIKQEGVFLIDDSIIANHLFYIIQETVNNALKHAGPDKITINISSKDTELSIVIENYIDTIKKKKRGGKSEKSLGIKIMKHRAMMIGADLEVKDNDNKFTVTIRLRI